MKLIARIKRVFLLKQCMKIECVTFLSLASVLLLAYLLAQLDLSKTSAALANANYSLLFAALLATLFAMGARTMRWKFLLDERKKLVFGRFSRCSALNRGIKFFSRQGVEAVKVIPLKNGFSYDFGLLTVFWERSFDVLVITSFAFLAFPFLNETIKLAIILAFGAVAVVMALMLRHFHKILAVLSKFLFFQYSKSRGTQFSQNYFARRVLLKPGYLVPGFYLDFPRVLLNWSKR